MRPEPIGIGLGAALACGWIVAAFFPAATAAMTGASGLVLMLLAVDAVRARREPAIEAEREVAAVLPLANWTRVAVRLEASRAQRPLALSVFDHHPDAGEMRGLPVELTLAPGGQATVGYRFRPARRGELRFADVDVRIRSPWGLWQSRQRVGEGQTVRVYPDFKSVQRYAILAVDNAVSRLGVRRRQRRGEGMELHQLREYRQGDALRQVDWKATSRRLKLISREYEDERNQQLVFLLDCGRSMRAVDGGVAHFDHALNSLLLLTYVALRQGDAVGLLTLGGATRWLPPQKGPAAMGAMLEAVYDLETTTLAPDFSAAATSLMARQRRRALVVLITNLRDEDGDEVGSALRLMRRRHLVLLASLRERVLDETLSGEVDDFLDALRLGAVHHYLEARRRPFELLTGRGVLAFDVVPERLPLAMVNRYLDVKRTGAL